MAHRLTVAVVAASAFMLQSGPGVAQQSSQQKPKLDPNQKVCEDVTQVGSRLAVKRICATRAEWEAKRKQDRDAVDDAQRSAHIGCNTINTHSGTPSC